jgi:hypothetical protein
MYDPAEEITLKVDSFDISGKNRKLKAVWSVEAAQDLRSVHNIDAEAALADTLAKEIVAEIDKEILNDMKNNQGAWPSWSNRSQKSREIWV